MPRSKKTASGRGPGSKKFIARAPENISIPGSWLSSASLVFYYFMTKSYNVAVIGGDGTGPEVTREAVKVLDVAAKKFNLKLNYQDYDLGGARYLRTQEALPDSAVTEL